MRAFGSPEDALNSHPTLVVLLQRAGDLARAIAEADAFRKNLEGSPSVGRWKTLAGLYEGLADAADKVSKLSSEKRLALVARLRAAAREAAQQAAKIEKKSPQPSKP
jgi:hypothetical protein